MQAGGAPRGCAEGAAWRGARGAALARQAERTREGVSVGGARAGLRRAGGTEGRGRIKRREQIEQRGARIIQTPEVRAFILHPHISLLGLVSLYSLTCVPSNPAILHGWKRRSEVERQGMCTDVICPHYFHEFSSMLCLFCCEVNWLFGNY